jgi:hypothetical protein
LCSFLLPRMQRISLTAPRLHDNGGRASQRGVWPTGPQGGSVACNTFALQSSGGETLETLGSGLAHQHLDMSEQSADGRVVKADVIGDLSHSELP